MQGAKAGVFSTRGATDEVVTGTYDIRVYSFRLRRILIFVHLQTRPQIKYLI